MLLKLCTFPMSTWKLIPGLWGCPVDQRVLKTPSSALAGTSPYGSVAEAEALQPLRSSGCEFTDGTPYTLNSLRDHQLPALPISTTLISRANCVEKDMFMTWLSRTYPPLPWLVSSPLAMLFPQFTPSSETKTRYACG